MIDPPLGGYQGLPLLVAEDGAVRPNYDFAKVHFVAEEEQKSVAAILIAVVQRKVLAALPAAVWSRVTAQRLLPPRALVKPYLVEVVAARAEAPEEVLEDEVIKLWIGFLDRRLAETAEALTGGETVDYDLRYTDVCTGEERIPFGQALADLAEDHFVFQSATEGGVPSGDGGGPPDVEQRMTMLEEGLIAIQTTLSELAEQRKTQTGGRPSVEGAIAAPLPPKRLSALKKPKEVDPMASLDPTVLHSARQAGIPEGQLHSLARLLGKTTRMADQPGTAAAPHRGMELSESDEDAEDEMAEAADQGASGLWRSRSEYPHREGRGPADEDCWPDAPKPGKDLEALLDGADGGSGEAGLGASSGKSKAAAYKRLKAALTENPATKPSNH